MTPLIQIGLFDIFEFKPSENHWHLNNLFTFVNELGSLFAESSYSWVDYEDYSQTDRYNLEQELLGVGLSPHPLHLAQKWPLVPINQFLIDG